MYRFRLTKLILGDGTTVEPAQVTLIVGPNNAGKSRFLKEVSGLVTRSHTDGLLVKDAESSLPATLEELRKSYDVERQEDVNRNHWSWRCLDTRLCAGARPSSGFFGSWPEAYEQHWKVNTGEKQNEWFFGNFGTQLIAYLTTEHRLQLVKENEGPGEQGQRTILLHELYYSKKNGERDLRAKIKDAFDIDIALDFTQLRRMLLRTGGDFTGLPGDPREAQPILSQCEKLDDQGDGLRAFVGVVVALLTLRRDVFLIDEPETFLHPPQSFRVGRFLGEQAGRDRQVIAATHSADVLRGVLSSGAQIRIIRIDRTGNTNKFRILDTEQIKSVANDPLLSSARVLDGLFYSGAVVVEADADARFYQTVSTKRRQDLDLHFVNADNKQTVPRIMGIYRDVGVRCVGIVDFDVLNSAAEFSQQVDAIHLQGSQKNRAIELRQQIANVAKQTPPADRLKAVEAQLKDALSGVSALLGNAFASPDDERQEYERLLSSLAIRFHQLAATTKAWKEFKERGKAALIAVEQPAFDELACICAEHGLFINPCGELESMLEEHGEPHTTDKKSWIRKALLLVAEFVVDDRKNPWAFMKNIHEYFTGPLHVTCEAGRYAS